MTADNPEPVRCPECEAYGGRHCFNCSLQTVEQEIAWGPHYHARWTEQIKLNGEYGIRLRKEVTLWQGKHALLRHENNKLRSKLRKQPAEQPEIVVRLRTLVEEWNRHASGALKYAEMKGITNCEILAEFGRLGRCAGELERLLDEIAPEKETKA